MRKNLRKNTNMSLLTTAFHHKDGLILSHQKPMYNKKAHMHLEVTKPMTIPRRRTTFYTCSDFVAECQHGPGM